MSSSTGDKKQAKQAGGIRTLADLNRLPDDGSHSDSDQPPEYYTGGEKSGMLVQDPKEGRNNNYVDAIFDQARQMGALEGPTERTETSRSRSFSGTGRLLSGETVVPSASQQVPEALSYNVTFWRNGFTVNDGPLRRLDDPDNAAFLESITKSECPKELEPPDRRIGVEVSLTRKDENCPEPVKCHVPFQGVGRTLGSGPSSSDGPGECVSAPAPSAGLFVDNSKPSTSIQLRLADGTRMVARFNYHHTVGDIRSFINASRPGGSRSYRLQTVGFPPQQLDDISKTIDEAGLANSVVVQKL